jgi:hypothetical protein
MTRILTNANELADYSDSFVYFEDSEIRMRLYTVKSHTVRHLNDAEARIALFTEDNDNSYYAAIEVDGEWCEFTLLYNTKQKDTIRFNSPNGLHFYADDYILRECGSTPLSNLLIGMMSNSRHIGEDVVYSALRIAKVQGLI